MKKVIKLTFLFFLFCSVTLVSCKSKGLIAESKAVAKISAAQIIENHYNSAKNFKTLYIKSDVDYKDKDQSLNVTAEIKIKKDEKILVSIRFFGITMAKALITPTQVQYYEKAGNKYFEGNYASLSQWLGTDLDFQKVQNMLIGQAIDDLKKGKYKTDIQDKLYKLESIADQNMEKAFYFEAANFLIKKQQIMQTAKNTKLNVFYPNYKDYPTMGLPTGIEIEASDNEKKTNIYIDYNTVNFDEEFSFPYSVPNGYERIFID